MRRAIFVLVLLAAIAAGLAYLSLETNYQGFREPVILDFTKGTSTPAMAMCAPAIAVSIGFPTEFHR